MSKQLHILLADDDTDDRFFFDMALKELSFSTQLTSVENGEKLMTYLSGHTADLPEILFLDMNMPRKNGAECLAEIKQNEKLQSLPVVIYSTSLHEDVADKLYKNGAHYYIRKTGIDELGKTLQYILTLMKENKFVRPSKEEFILRLALT